MEILVTNDDGWGAQGITVLAKIMTRLGHVTVVAPDGPRSSTSNAISMHTPMKLQRVDISQDDRFTDEEKAQMDVYITNGTPADCVKLALFVLHEEDNSHIDLMVSGINHGSNASINVVYSGTMGACFTGGEHSIRGIGFSIDDFKQPTDFSHFEPYILEITKHLIEQPWPVGMSYNVNAPLGEIKGIKWARQCRGHWCKEIEPRVNEKGETEYWLAGEFVNDEPEAEDTDQWAINHGYISIQPCTVDLTKHDML